ncbi:hypothetical protein A2697_03670 [Candidatus Curtissbacteria bacterium RIFCSPHIGHO2_01_FULL_41_44]|uniref:General secretion pathway GspH domain-containing protein n=1 Tax=Candidatus Curtissbacteria bacterium RIFCSPLOWO2_01_FULL_42_50 TaxID=1797730 RepID=A0A1F5H7N2_9BACT|nr:MAG: hypothetical protein A2697_03670 [Candidatus Curtissbacteria bacterium RIFCSPHIGHO2_01_FULL_41_44]OGD94265.1 MAG: hypothetical protein A3C33_02830 [Candidatus Curtissbacteria bacterium RIFCSPHIGHO2_02_FULL_42_58]OGD97739.1 MAG: hypothetical protein A3E71_03340 [Candidatus Curtissbacteria bacterium RIFCSPHIGHO2_12_FULL_42_33]OGE00131.1 MAG: hypothetical protein A3B54_01885 [Candidatus Curtissbacteria bacterium RIFCSPLOWO2_01_FULL_42_50]OGE09780.1 MAG: hypothetical protein A3H87_02545 [Ca
MPFLKVKSDKQQATSRNLVKTYHLSLITYHFKLKLGFSLIELLIVISIFGITASVITASFLNFERNQRLKNAALQLKNDLRLVQNNALSGNKGVVGGTCNPTSPNPAILLVGWYVILDAGLGSNDKYTISRDCNVSGTEQSFDTKTVLLPRGVTISAIKYGVFTKTSVNILFQPLTQSATFWNTAFTPPSGQFLNVNGDLDQSKLTGSIPQDSVSVELSSQQVPGVYKVIIQPSGETNESKP